MMDPQLTSRKAMCYVLALLLLAGAQGFSSSTNSNRQELRSMIEMFNSKNGDDPVALVDSVWTSQDLDLIDDCIWSGQTDLVTAIKVHFGNAADSPFKTAVAVRLLRAPATVWGGPHAIPSTGSGTVDLAMRRAILDVISRNLGAESAVLEDLKDEATRKSLSQNLEAKLNIGAHKYPKDGHRVDSGNNKSSTQRDFDEETQGDVPNKVNNKESVASHLLMKVALGLSAAIVLVLIVSWVRRAKLEGITRRRS